VSETRPFDATELQREAAAAAPALLDAVRARLTDSGAEALLVTAPANVRYLSGFSSPEDGAVLVTLDDAWLITDDRYTVQAGEESWLSNQVITREIFERAAGLLEGQTLAVEADHMTIAWRADLERHLNRPVVTTQDLLRPLRMVKRPFEVAWLREAARITDVAFGQVVDATLRPGVRELDVALELERAMRGAGAAGVSFEIIVASGPRSAMPHGVASHRPIEAGDLVTIDCGARVGGYHADMTRAIGVGAVQEPLRSWFDAVLAAQRAGVAAIAPGADGTVVDAAARDLLSAVGLGDAFGHSLGHGTGLEIHEGPRLSPRSKDTLAPGMVVTVEPGVYVAGTGGLRIEDLVLVTDTGGEVLSHTPKDYREVG